MPYTITNAHGDAGEYLVAYTITHLFKFPCRLYGVDIGVDAEMEFIDENNESTGDVIKIQIKSFESIPSKDFYSVYPSDKHIGYWKRFCLPLILCCVDLEKTKIYWKQITATEAFKSSGESGRVDFNLKEDVLDKESLSKLRNLVFPPESKDLNNIFQEILEDAEKFCLHPVYADYEAIKEDEEECLKLNEKIKKFETLVAHFPWRVSSICLMQLNSIKSTIKGFKINLNYYRASLSEG